MATDLEWHDLLHFKENKVVPQKVIHALHGIALCFTLNMLLFVKYAFIDAPVICIVTLYL
jgi:hypothetical protein